jgi:hypothetical protein
MVEETSAASATLSQECERLRSLLAQFVLQETRIAASPVRARMGRAA